MEKGMTDDKMIGWHHQINGHEFEQIWGDGEGQGTVLQFLQLSCSYGVAKSQT